MKGISPLVRLAPLQIGELPDHSIFSQGEPTSAKRPDLIPFLIKLLDDGNSFVHDKSFNLSFKPHTHKSAPPSNTDVEILAHTTPLEDLEQLNWKETGIPGFERSRPRHLQTEYWFARRSYHKNVSVKTNPSTANWDEFVYGLRDQHSKHEYDFSPTIYDAHLVIDWNEDIRKAFQNKAPGTEGIAYTDITLSVYEMCHAIPWPLKPRCFPILVATASTSSNRFIAVTVPVNLSSFPAAMYANDRNMTEGTDSQTKKEVVVGAYTAVEEVELFTREVKGKTGEKEELIQWVMATASDAGGSLPMAMQKSSIPGQLPKDVSYFLKWIKDVSEGEIQAQKPGTSTASRIYRSARRSLGESPLPP